MDGVNVEIPDDTTLVTFVADSARRVPGKVALAFAADRRTYAALEDRTARLAAALTARGVAPGDHVAILMVNRIELLEAVLACHKVGAAAVPVNFRLSQPEIDYILNHCRARAILSDDELAERAVAGAKATPTVRAHLTLAEMERAITDVTKPATPHPIAPADVALVMYTSGTTGRPKGAMLTHRNMVAQACNMTADIGVTSDDVWLSGAPLFHIAGMAGVLPFLQHGATAVITPSGDFDPHNSVALLKDHGVTACFFVPTQWDAICRVPEATTLAPTLRTAIWGASPATRPTLELMQRVLAGADVTSNFGQTEMSPSTTWLKGPDSLRKMGSVGRPASNVEIRIVDDDNNDVAPGEVGEIVYRGPTVMKGYLDDEAATADAFAGGWFHSGDLVRADDEGFLYVAGRKKDMIISGGENIYPAEVEEVLVAHPDVADAAVVGVPHPRWVETPVAIVVRAPGATIGEDALIEHCRGALAGYKKPTRVVFADVLPRNAGGKVLKRVLRDQLLTEAPA
jgi:fatty-acyl-CoA synthase